MFGIHGSLVHFIYADNEEKAWEIYEGVKADLKNYINSATLDDGRNWKEPFVSQWYS